MYRTTPIKLGSSSYEIIEMHPQMLLLQLKFECTKMQQPLFTKVLRKAIAMTLSIKVRRKELFNLNIF
jgi:hypothetical protein